MFAKTDTSSPKGDTHSKGACLHMRIASAESKTRQGCMPFDAGPPDFSCDPRVAPQRLKEGVKIMAIDNTLDAYGM